MLDSKALKKLAETCRKVGIRHFKSAEFEFTLTDSPLPSVSKKKTAQNFIVNADTGEFETDFPTEEQLLYYSSGDTAA